jgi:TRAP-type C4-dicarboxylate transport system substrate-binding protein
MRSENRSEVFAKYETEAKELARKILQETTEKCRLMEEETEKNCREMIKMAHLEAAKAIEKQKADGEIKINLSIPTEE